MENIGIVFVISFLTAVISGPPIVRKLKKMKFGQKILEDGPTWHMSKQYTPTMGGWIFILAVFVSLAAELLLSSDRDILSTSAFVAVFALVFGIIGAVDDMTKIKKKQNAGLTPLQKLLLQIGAAAIFVTVLRNMGYIEPSVYIPFFNTVISVSWPFYLAFAIFTIVATVNAVNLTDGIDGLATSVTIIVTAFFMFVYMYLGENAPLSFSVALLGGLFAFYIFNRFPAKVFMGDTGSLFLGGAVAGMAFAINAPLFIPIVGLIYVVEALSDILQVAYFKISGGKRIFKMAPIHHHFEMCGWSENKIVMIFSLITMALCVITYLSI